MRLFVGFALSMLFVVLPVHAKETSNTSHLRPVHTYSIVARDPKTGQMGVAVQSHWFSIGSLVPWAEAGVGAVATQSFIDVRYGTTGLKLMRDGWDAGKTLAALKVADAHPEVRQVAMIDVNGNVAAHTGKNCIQYAGHRVGKNFSVQANLMIEEGVVEAMEETFLRAKGTLAERMLQVLEAAQMKGGDVRGKQSAAIIVVKAQSTGKPWQDRIVDLHVEDNPKPVQELKRLYKLHIAYEHMNKGDLAIEENDIERALKEYGAAQKLVPENLEMKFWHAVSLVNAKRVDESLPIFKKIFAKDNNWRKLVPRLSAVKILPSEKKIIDRIVSIKP